MRKIKNAPSQAVAEFLSTCRKAASYGLMRCSSGNLSMRVNETAMLIKASRSWISEMTAADIAVCRISDGALLEGPRPSVELGFHSGILRARPDVKVVMHFQTPFATSLACLKGGDINYFVIPEIPFYIGPVAHIPYLPPGSEALARAVIRAMRDHDMAVMANHGQVTIARDAAHAIQNAVFFELACEIIVRCGGRAKPLPAKAVRALLKQRRAAGYV